MVRKLAIIGTALAVMLSWGSKASALSVSDPNVVGTVYDGIPFSDANRVTYTNTLLGMNIGTFTCNQASCVDGQVYTKYHNYTGSVSLAASSSGSGVNSISGYEYVLVKYDGPNAGVILFYVGGGTFDLPPTSDQVFASGSCGVNCGISGWTAFNSVPDGGSTIALLGSGLVAFGLLRRRFMN